MVGAQRRQRFQHRYVTVGCARKSSPCVLKTPQIRCFCPCWASFFADEPLQAPCWANFLAPTDIAPGLVGGVRPPCRKWWGVALHEAVVRCVAGVSDPRVVQFPPLLSAACGFVCAPGFPRVLMGAHTFSLRSRNVTVSQVCSRHIQCRLCHRIRAGTPAQSASITSTTTRP